MDQTNFFFLISGHYMNWKSIVNCFLLPPEAKGNVTGQSVRFDISDYICAG